MIYTKPYILFLGFVPLVLLAVFITPRLPRNGTGNSVIEAPVVFPPVFPTLAPTIPPLEETLSQPSPDGKKRVVMHVTHQPDGSGDYVFSTTDGNGENEVRIYTASLAEGRFRLPFNSWSPDNKYLFVQKDSGEAYVFTADGTDISQGQQYLDVKNIFSEKQKTDIYNVVTGWASPTLLIVNTTAPDGSKGHSYWFEVPSKAVIQLSGDF